MTHPPATPDPRALVSCRVLPATPERVYAAFQDPAQLAQWWGPAGFRNSFEVFEFTPGGDWRFTMHAPDGTGYANSSRFAELVPARRVVIEHLSSHRFVLTINLAPEGDGATRIDWTQRFETEEECQRIARFVAEANQQNLDRLEALLARSAAP